jgi:AcrR family transcriptional regulator
MQHPPSASQLLATVADLLNEEVLPALSGPVQHKARVAASLVSIIEREIRLGPDAQREEHRLLGEIFALTVSDASSPPGDLDALRSSVATQLRNGAASTPDVHAQVWERLMQIVRADLSIAKPGYDSWDGV